MYFISIRLLWFEPERVAAGTMFDKLNPGYLLSNFPNLVIDETLLLRRLLSAGLARYENVAIYINGHSICP